MPRQIKRHIYDTSSSESFDLSETDSKGASPHESSLDDRPRVENRSSSGGNSEAGRRMQVEQIHVVQRAGSIDDTASLMTEATDDFQLEFPGTTSRKASDGSSSEPPLPPSLHRERTAPISNRASSPNKPNGRVGYLESQQESKSPSTRKRDPQKTERLMPPARTSTPHTKKNSSTVSAAARNNLRKPSPCPDTDKPSRPVRKASPGYYKALSKTTSATESPDQGPSDQPRHDGSTTMKKLSHKWKYIDFSNSKPKLETSNPKPPLAPKGIGQRRWREESSPTTESLDTAEEMESQITIDLESNGTSGFDSDSRRLSSLTFLTNHAPAAPGEKRSGSVKHKRKGCNDIIVDGRYAQEEEAPLNDSSKTEMMVSTCGQTIPPLIYEDIIIGKEAVVELSSRMPSSSTKSYNRSEGSHVQTSPSMATIPEVEFGNAEAPNTIPTTPDQQDTGTTHQNQSISWRLTHSLRSSLRSMIPPLSPTSPRQSNNDDGNLNSSHGQITSDQGSSRRTIRSLITARWSLVLPSRRLESSVKPVKIEVEQEEESVRPPTLLAKVIFGLIVSILFLTAVIICLAILLARRDDMQGLNSNTFPTPAPTIFSSTAPTVEMPSKPPDNDFSDPRLVGVSQLSEQQHNNGKRQLYDFKS